MRCLGPRGSKSWKVLEAEAGVEFWAAVVAPAEVVVVVVVVGRVLVCSLERFVGADRWRRETSS